MGIMEGRFSDIMRTYVNFGKLYLSALFADSILSHFPMIDHDGKVAFPATLPFFPLCPGRVSTRRRTR
jgi:hypothetical protein